MQNEVFQEKDWRKSCLMAEGCLHVPLATGPALLRKASPRGRLQIYLGVPGPLGPGVGQFATTATVANVHTFLLALEDLRHGLLCPSNRTIRA